jgi:hypothetical protein
MGTCSFQIRNETFFCKVKEIKGLRGDVHMVRRTRISGLKLNSSQHLNASYPHAQSPTGSIQLFRHFIQMNSYKNVCLISYNFVF